MGSMGESMPKGTMEVPKTMKALQYAKPEDYAVVEIEVPTIGDEDVLVKISACGVCGTDLHYHKGEFLAKFPLIPVPGGFAEYCRYPARQVHPIGDLPSLEAVLVEPAACASHGIARMQPKVGSTVLLFGCGPTGMLLAQLLKMNGTANLTIASMPGPKLDLARELRLADSYVEVSTSDPKSSMDALKEAHPYGFDIVVEATGALSVLEQSIFYVRKGGTLVVYGVYDDLAKVPWPPSRIWTYEITIMASFCSHLNFPVVLEYLRTKKLDFSRIVNKTYHIEQWAECLEAVRKQEVVKAAIVFD